MDISLNSLSVIVSIYQSNLFFKFLNFLKEVKDFLYGKISGINGLVIFSFW